MRCMIRICTSDEMPMADLVVQAFACYDQGFGTTDEATKLGQRGLKTAWAVVDTLERFSPTVEAVKLSRRMLLVQ